MKRLLMYLIMITIILSGCSFTAPEIDGTQIKLSDNKITVDGKEITNDNTQAVYSSNDIVFYLAGQDFTYGEGTSEDAHEQSEADAHTVVNITKSGRYDIILLCVSMDVIMSVRPISRTGLISNDFLASSLSKTRL